MDLKVPSPLAPADDGAAVEGLLLQVRELSTGGKAAGKQPKAADQVSDVSFQVEPNELVVLTGTGRPAKSCLLKTLAGVGPKPGGEVLINGVDLYTYRKLFAPYIGYVPAEPALHSALTVQEILDYEARLRMAGRPTKAERRARVQQVLDDLALQPQARRRFGTLSSYHKYLTSIAVELILGPGLLVLDTPTESLEPAEEIRLSGLLKAIAQRGTTVIQSSEVARCAQIADKVLALAEDGTLAWFGPFDEALAYFQHFARPEPAPLTFDGVLEMLATPCQEPQSAENGGAIVPAGETWQKRFTAHPAYATYVDDPLNDKYPDLLLQDRPLARFRGAAKEKTPPKKVPQVGAFSKFATLTSRSLRVLGRDRSGLWLLLAPPLVALLDFLISSPQMFDPLKGDPVRVPIALGLVVFMEMLTAALIFHNEISKERRIYQRDRRILTLSWPYALSKVWIVFLAALYQGLVWGIIHFFASGMAGGVQSLPQMWITLALVALVGGVLGLIASGLARSAHVAVLIVLALVVPQLLLSGSVLPMPRLGAPAKILSLGAPARYAFESLLTLSGYGQDVVNDPCWQIPDVMRNSLSETDKQKCTCLGDNIFSRCQFPGIHKFFTFVIEQPPPAEPVPAAAGSLPPQPVPAQGESLNQFAQAVNTYTQQLQNQMNDYQQSVQTYTRSLAAWQQARSQVTGNAEGVIALALEQYGQGFQVNLPSHWIVMFAISLVLIALLIGIQQGKGYEI